MAYRSGQASQDLVQDVTQEVYLKIFAEDCRVLRTLRSRDEPAIAALVQAIAYSVGCDHFRRNTALKRGGRQPVVSLNDAAESGTCVAPETETVLRSILFEQIDIALKEVSDQTKRTEQRRIFWLYFRHGFTARDIAEMPSCELSVKGVESLLLRLTKSVRQKLAGPEGKRPAISSGGAGRC
jgi:RNA polymerase sigma-70 factor (ECF subfamily)